MSSEKEKTEDTARMLRLLWRHRLGEEEGARGPRKRLNVDQIVDTAIGLADREGLAAFSMRRVAEALGTSATSLYTYIPGRSELIGLMIDQVIGRTGLPSHEGELRDRLNTLAHLLWEEYHRHPWLLDAHSHRPWIGPNISARYEWELEAVDGCGFDDVAMDHVISLIESHAAASAANSVHARQLEESSGITDLEWWNVHGPILAEVMPVDEFPVSGRVGSAVGEAYAAVTSHRAVFEFGLEVILDGIEARRRRGFPEPREENPARGG